MTVSMPTTRLSSVITGCGGDETTCSRRSISGLTRSTNGTTSARPGSSVRWKRPRRSTTPARAWGTIRTPDAATNSTNRKITIRAITPPDTRHSSFGHERRGAPDLDHLNPLARLEDPLVVERARAPVLTLELDGPAVLVGALEHDRVAADEPRGAGAQLRREAPVRARERAQAEEQDDGDGDGGEHARRHPEAGEAHHRGDERPDRERRQEEAHRGRLARGEDDGRDQPIHPVVHLPMDPTSRPKRGTKPAVCTSRCPGCASRKPTRRRSWRPSAGAPTLSTRPTASSISRSGSPTATPARC